MTATDRLWSAAVEEMSAANHLAAARLLFKLMTAVSLGEPKPECFTCSVIAFLKHMRDLRAAMIRQA